jgi:hypothetical protein
MLHVWVLAEDGRLTGERVREAALLIREGRAEGAMDEARGEICKLEQHLAELDRARRSHLTQLRAMAERQLAEIEAVENAPGPHFPTLSRPSRLGPPSTNGRYVPSSTEPTS